MNEREREELERLKQRQARLEWEISLLSTQLRTLEKSIADSEAASPPKPTPQQTPLASGAPVPQAEPKREPVKPPPLPPIIPPPQPAPKPAQSLSAKISPPPEPPKAAPPVVETKRVAEPILPATEPPRSETAPPEKTSFEMRLGTYWLVRIGAVLVLTGLAFFGNLAYQKMGAGGKVALLYLAGGLLLGAGYWWQRQATKETLKNYAQVLFAGGLASIYFTTYAMHHVATLKIIESPLLDGFLLLAWAGFIVWIADRKKSELLALFAVGLAYYTSVITPVGTFTLYSNLILAITTVFFLVRNRWAGLSWASLVATYAGYGYWRFFGPSGWHWPQVTDGLWLSASFLWGYWLIFTLAVFLSKHAAMAGDRRAAFLTFNNGAMFTLFLMTMFEMRSGKFWLFSLCYGTVLLALAELARRFLSNEPITKNTYLTQGLLLVTVGIISHYLDTPRTLALVLATESVILFILGTFRKNIFLQTGAYVVGALSIGWGVDGLDRTDRSGLLLGIAIGALMLFNAWWSHWRTLFNDRREVRPVPAYFTVLTLVMWLFTTWFYTSRENFGPVLAAEALALTFSVYLLRVPEVPLFGTAYILLAQVAWSLSLPAITAREFALVLMANSAAFVGVSLQRPNELLRVAGYVSAAFALVWGIAGLERYGPAGLSIGILLGIFFAALAHWMHQRSKENEIELLRIKPAYFTALALLMWVATTWQNTEKEIFPLVVAIEAVVLTASIYVLRVREFPLMGQGLLVLAEICWLAFFVGDNKPLPPWWNPVLLIAITLGVSHWWQRQKAIRMGAWESNAWQSFYALALVAVACVWLEPHNSPSMWIEMTSLLAVGVTAYGVFTRAWPLAIAGQIFLFVSGYRLATMFNLNKPLWQFPLAPIAALGVMSLATWLWFARRPDSKAEVKRPLLQLAMIYRWVALLMSLWWVNEYIHEGERVWVHALIGSVVFVFAAWRRNREALIFGGVFTLAGLATLWMTTTREQLVYLPNFLAVLAMLGQQQVLRRRSRELPEIVHSIVVVVGGLTLWRLVSAWVLLSASEFYLTASWSALAFVLLGCGVVLREKMYRWTGLGILATALGRIVIFDVWKLETSQRVLSFMALGVVLIVLGFIYIKYEERIRKWL